MDNRIAQNALNFFLSDRFTYKGTDTMPLLEIIRELQTGITNGPTTNTTSGNSEAPSIGPEPTEDA